MGSHCRRHPAHPVCAGLPGCPAAARRVSRRPPATPAARPREGGRARLHEGARGRVFHHDQSIDAGHRPPAAHGCQPVRLRPGNHVRRVPAAGRGDLPPARRARDGVLRGGGARARCAAGGQLLRGPPGNRGDAPGRPGAQPGAPLQGGGAVGSPEPERRRSPRRARRVPPSCGRAAAARRPGAAVGPRAPASRAVHHGPPRGPGGGSAGTGRGRPRPRQLAIRR